MKDPFGIYNPCAWGTATYIPAGNSLPGGGSAIHPGMYQDLVEIPAPSKWCKCPYCGRRNDKEAELCKACGAPIE